MTVTQSKTLNPCAEPQGQTTGRPEGGDAKPHQASTEKCAFLKS